MCIWERAPVAHLLIATTLIRFASIRWRARNIEFIVDSSSFVRRFVCQPVSVLLWLVRMRSPRTHKHMPWSILTRSSVLFWSDEKHIQKVIRFSMASIVANGFYFTIFDRSPFPAFKRK